MKLIISYLKYIYGFTKMLFTKWYGYCLTSIPSDGSIWRTIGSGQSLNKHFQDIKFSFPDLLINLIVLVAFYIHSFPFLHIIQLLVFLLHILLSWSVQLSSLHLSLYCCCLDILLVLSLHVNLLRIAVYSYVSMKRHTQNCKVTPTELKCEFYFHQLPVLCILISHLFNIPFQFFTNFNK